MSDEPVRDDKDEAPSAEVERNAEANRQRPTEADQKKQQIEYDEVLDDRFQATDN